MAGLYRKNDRTNWLIQFNAPDGHRRSLNGGTYKPAARALAERIERLVSLRRAGLPLTQDMRRWLEDIDPKIKEKFVRWGLLEPQQAFSAHPINEHVKAYMEHCRHVGHSAKHLQMKQKFLDDLVKRVGATRLIDLEPNAVQRHLRLLKDEGRSARTVNQARAAAVAFVNWCVSTGRTNENRLSIIPKLDEKRDRRRVRRALSDEELSWLLKTAKKWDDKHGQRFASRYAVYLTAAMTGLRRSELRQITWADVDLDAGVLRITAAIGKSKREDFVPMHPQVAEVLTKAKRRNSKLTDRVFKTMPTINTFYKDLARARKAWIKDADTEKARKQRRKSDFLKQTDSESRVIDLHAMRTTLGTNLALSNIAPQLAQRIMRHADYRTTLQHYTILGLADTAAAVSKLNSVSEPKNSKPSRKTGTEG